MDVGRGKAYYVGGRAPGSRARAGWGRRSWGEQQSPGRSHDYGGRKNKGQRGRLGDPSDAGLEHTQGRAESDEAGGRGGALGEHLLLDPFPRNRDEGTESQGFLGPMWGCCS